jgi:hypothetical protein
MPPRLLSLSRLRRCRSGSKLCSWMTKFKTVDRDQHDRYPIACTTQAGLMTADNRFDEMVRYWKRGPRTLAVVDERLKAAKTFCVSMECHVRLGQR